MTQIPFISVVSPVFNAEKIVNELVNQIEVSVSSISQDYEIILVEDGSRDDSWKKISDIAQINKNVIGLKLSRNFGQHQAITAGLDYSKGNWVVVLDCDLQDNPKEIIRLLDEANKGFDIVFARRVRRQDSFLKKLSSVIFYKIFAYLTDIPQDQTIANFGIYSRKSIDAVCKLKETNRSFATLIKWIGFKKSAVDVEHNERYSGKSSYNWLRLINLAIDIIIAHSDKPLRLVVKTGFLISILSFAFALYNLILYLNGYIKVLGYTSLIFSIWFLSGLIILILGLIGLYLSKVLDGVKNRPIYIVDINTKDKI